MQNLHHLWADKFSLIKFFKEAPNMDIHPRLKYFHDVFPYAESLPVNFYLFDLNDISLACNQETLARLGHRSMTDYLNLDPQQYLQRSGWPKWVVDDFISHNHMAISKGTCICQEKTPVGSSIKKWATRKDAIFDESGHPVGVIGVTMLIGHDNQFIDWDQMKNTITLRLNHGKNIELSGREFTVLQGLLNGATAEKIGAQEFISPKTVETYLMRIKNKLECKKSRDVVSLLIREGMAKEIAQFTLQSYDSIYDNDEIEEVSPPSQAMSI